MFLTFCAVYLGGYVTLHGDAITNLVWDMHLGVAPSTGHLEAAFKIGLLSFTVCAASAKLSEARQLLVAVLVPIVAILMGLLVAS